MEKMKLDVSYQVSRDRHSHFHNWISKDELATMVYVRIILLYLLLKPILAVNICTNLDSINSVEKGRMLNGSIITNTTTVGLIACARDCLLRRRCKSFNFNRETGECHLNSKTSDSDSRQLKSHDSFVFSDISAWPETLTGECANHACPLNAYCDSLNKSHYVCKTTGCLGYPIINHGHLRRKYVPEESPKGTVVPFACDEEYMRKGEVVCQDNGIWFSAVCVGIPSCSMWKQIHPDSEDGEYWLRLTNFDSIRTRMYCHLMSTPSPQEFLTLPYINYGIYPRMEDQDCDGITRQLSGDCTDEGGEIWFNKLRVNISTMEVLTEDRTFTKYSDSSDKLRYGVAYDCYTNHPGNALKCGTRGKFTIDLRGTGWRIGNDQEWKAYGWMPMIEKVDRKMNGTLVDLKCGGYGGGCAPKEGLFLKPVP